MKTLFFKYSADNRLLNQVSKAGLLAKRRFLGFARKWQPWLRSKHNVAYTNKVPDDLQLTPNHPGLLLET